MTLSKMVRSALVAGTGAALVFGTGVSAAAHTTSAADVPSSHTTMAATESDNFAELMALLAQLPEFQGKTLDQIQAEILAAIKAQVQADATADAAAEEGTTAEADTDTDIDKADTDTDDTDKAEAEGEDQAEAPKVKTITPPRQESRQAASVQ